MKPKALSFILWLVYSSVAQAQQPPDWTWGGPIDPLQQKVSIEHYELNLELVPDKQWIEGFVRISFSCNEKTDTLRLNLIESYEVTRVEFFEGPVNFRHFGDTLDIHMPDGCSGVATVHYQGKTPIAPNPPWTGGFTWENDSNGNHWMGLSCQNEGAKIFMPCLDHPSSEPSRGVDLHITAPSPYFVAANGRLVDQHQEGEKITYHWTTDYPINNYNINFTLGVFHEENKKYRSVNGKEIPLIAYTLTENEGKAPKLLSVLENSVRTHEKFFGPFPFPDDKIAVVETPYLGMEHQTINGYGNDYKFEKVGDSDHDWLLHHELGHEWWGNKVSVADWADFWIHEGLCTYGDWLYYLEHGGQKAYLKKVADMAKTIHHKNPVALPKNSTSDEAYHIEIYYKGAFIMHSLRYILGDETFFPMLKAFLADERFTYTNLVNTKDFTDFVQIYSGKDLEDFFQLYLYRTTVPKVEVLKKGEDSFEVSFSNIEFSLPMDIHTSSGIQRVEISSKPILITSTETPVIDPEGWYLKQ